ncbi:MAG: hypothetical protein ABFD08_20245 [Syntrophomonas sp.]
MLNISKFSFIDGVPDEEEVENWTIEFFHSMMTVFNTFFAKLDLEEALSRISIIPFENMVKEQLQDESEEVIAIAVAKINELVETELEFMRAYIG